MGRSKPLTLVKMFQTNLRICAQSVLYDFAILGDPGGLKLLYSTLGKNYGRNWFENVLHYIIRKI